MILVTIVIDFDGKKKKTQKNEVRNRPVLFSLCVHFGGKKKKKKT